MKEVLIYLMCGCIWELIYNTLSANKSSEYRVTLVHGILLMLAWPYYVYVFIKAILDTWKGNGPKIGGAY